MISTCIGVSPMRIAACATLVRLRPTMKKNWFSVTPSRPSSSNCTMWGRLPACGGLSGRFVTRSHAYNGNIITPEMLSEVMQYRSGRSNGRRAVPEPEAVQRGHFEVLTHREQSGFRRKDPIIVAVQDPTISRNRRGHLSDPFLPGLGAPPLPIRGGEERG